jgi:hypothetical protein
MPKRQTGVVAEEDQIFFPYRKMRHYVNSKTTRKQGRRGRQHPLRRGGLALLRESSMGGTEARKWCRGMHNILEVSIESRCNKAVALIRPMERWGKANQGQVGAGKGYWCSGQANYS